jgi:hypothetical protein
MHDCIEDGGIDSAGFAAEPFEQGEAGGLIDLARDPAGIAKDPLDRRRQKEAGGAAGNLQTVIEVFGGFGKIERPEIALHADTLPQRLIDPVRQALAQFGLTDQHYTQQIAVIELEIRQQTDFVKSLLVRYKLGLIDDQNRANPFFVQPVQFAAKLFEQIGLQP